MSATIDLIDKRIHDIDASIVSVMMAEWENTGSTPDWAAEMLSEHDELLMDRHNLWAEEMDGWATE